jgi:serine/threonine protein kinase
MTSERWHQIEKLFHSALDLPSEARATFLSRECAKDENLRDEVNSLLRAHERDGSFLDVPAYEVADSLLTEGLMGLSPGQQIGPYQIISLLVEGGMGELYLAHDNRLSRKIVLKLLPIDFARDRHRVRRFVQEARVASNLNHPNVCVIHEIGRTMDGRHFIAMEYIDGVTLRERISRKSFTLGETLHVAEQVCAALSAAHAAGVVHRDIKPENIMLRRDRLVKVLDFGLAKLIESESRIKNVNEAPTMAKLKTEEGTQMGTVRYMSPEQLREGTVDERTDVWSFGVVLHEMATGFAPFEARVRNEIIAAILKREPTPLSFDETTPEEFQRIVAKALSKERKDRYQTIGEMATDLKAFRRQVHGESTEEPVWPVDVPLSSGSKKRTGNGGADAESRARHRRPGYAGTSDTWSSALTYVSRTAEQVLSEIKGHPRTTVFAGLALVIALFVGGNSSSVRQRIRNYLSPSPAPKYKIEPITNAGQSVCAAISADGKLFAHVEKKSGLQELHVTSVSNSSATSVVVAAGDHIYRGVTFSRDGNYLYFTRSDSNSDVGDLYQVALPGGTPRRLLDRVDGPISFSPTGDRFAFVRWNRITNEYSLTLANVDGTGERTIATRRDGQTFSIFGCAWSPDDESLVCGIGWWDKNFHAKLVRVDLSNGQLTPISDQQWYFIRQVAWLPDKSGLIVSAKDQPLSPFQLWTVSTEGKVDKLTRDLNEYNSVSISRDEGAFISVQSRLVGSLWSGPAADSQQLREVASNVGRVYGLDWSSKGQILFSSLVGNNLQISSIFPDGSGKNTITVKGKDDYSPATSPDGHLIAFSSNRSGSLNIWRMNAEDGGDLKQLTFGDGNAHPTFSADGRWILYDNQNGPFSVWKVSVDGGEAVKLIEHNAWMPAVSPDNQFIACRYDTEPTRQGIAIIPFQGGAPTKLLHIPVRDWQRIQWSPDSRFLSYVDISNGVYNIWTYEIASDTRKH